jgi:hypothetical protein
MFISLCRERTPNETTAISFQFLFNPSFTSSAVVTRPGSSSTGAEALYRQADVSTKWRNWNRTQDYSLQPITVWPARCWVTVQAPRTEGEMRWWLVQPVALLRSSNTSLKPELDASRMMRCEILYGKFPFQSGPRKIALLFKSDTSLASCPMSLNFRSQL